MSEEEGFTYEIRTRGSYDYRDELHDKQGCNGVELRLILRGPDAALTCDINTGWLLRPLAGELDQGREKQVRRDRPGVDSPLADIFPVNAGVWLHSPNPNPRHKGWWKEAAECSVLGAGACYGDGSWQDGEKVLEGLIRDGDDGWRSAMRELYRSWVENPDV